MACPRGKASPNTETKLRLFAASAGHCQNPSCLKNLFLEINDKDLHIAEMAHVFSASNNGPRSNKDLSSEARGSFENLILLCANCHTMIDKNETSFPEALVFRWKKTHAEKIRSTFGVIEFGTRKEAKYFIDNIIMENRTIFDEYGPNTEERFNPESDLPAQWQRKIRTSIIPNNRKLLLVLDVNKNLLNANERLLLERFRQHVDDFEAKHIGESTSNGTEFPQEMNRILED